MNTTNANHMQQNTVSLNSPNRERLAFFDNRSANRYWWNNHSGARYLPPVLSSLSDTEWSILREWYEDTEKKFSSPGEISIPGISLLASLIAGNNLSSIVQCGHYVGYSTLLLGFLLRYMQNKHSLYSIDIDATVTTYTQNWVYSANLSDYVKLTVADSASSEQPTKAMEYLKKEPQLLFIDSSHRYSHTLLELELWFPHLAEGGFVVLHDASQFASEFDSSGEGGVYRAILEWSDRNNAKPFLINSFVQSTTPNRLIYRDGCGLAIFQKPIR